MTVRDQKSWEGVQSRCGSTRRSRRLVGEGSLRGVRRAEPRAVPAVSWAGGAGPQALKHACARRVQEKQGGRCARVGIECGTGKSVRPKKSRGFRSQSRKSDSELTGCLSCTGWEDSECRNYVRQPGGTARAPKSRIDSREETNAQAPELWVDEQLLESGLWLAWSAQSKEACSSVHQACVEPLCVLDGGHAGVAQSLCSGHPVWWIRKYQHLQPSSLSSEEQAYLSEGRSSRYTLISWWKDLCYLLLPKEQLVRERDFYNWLRSVVLNPVYT